ncbi:MULTISPECIES: nicotinate (nicotinamide) nucleotide adenylyltransferase [unclassified Desulfovibrio]|uniref:nicotinate (nicotinamide) nucleotide adenylyltransferase n=1 Tax=unclassified Desulfovibrio TaxID=2593640 RepID=UPI002FD902CD
MTQHHVTGKPRLRVGIYGGSFNPVHLGHVRAVELFVERLQLDCALVIPSSFPFYKNTRPTPFMHRYAMCLLAFQKTLKVIVSDLERNHPRGMHTCDVIREIRSHYDTAALYLLVGVDVFRKMPGWEDVNSILRETEIVVLRRETEEEVPPFPFPGARVTVLDDPALPLSASEIRSDIEAGCSVQGKVPEEVAEYMETFRLYGIRGRE